MEGTVRRNLKSMEEKGKEVRYHVRGRLGGNEGRRADCKVMSEETCRVRCGCQVLLLLSL